MKVHKFLPKFALLLFVFVFTQTAVSAKDEWRQVRSANFNLIGNAEEKDIRKVAARLEQFREALRQILDQYNFNSPVPTTVIVFKTAADYKPYKPVKESGETDDFVVGYFQSNEDVNYITLSAEGDPARVYNIIFHEYTHFVIRNNLGESKIPPWYNEGLAEYYETFAVKDDQSIELGGLKTDLLKLLRQKELIPFDTFFNIDNYSLHRQGDDGVGLFYAQAWALMHYLKHGDGGARRDQLDKFLRLVMANKAPKEAFAEAFQTEYAAMENELRKYIKQDSFTASSVTLKNKLSDVSEMKSVPISEAQAEAYLGDLLFHANRFAEAEAHLQKALELDADLGMAQASLGLIKMQREDFDGALRHLEKAVRADSGNYLVHYYYAYVLSRQGMSEFGFVSEYNTALAEAMREALKRAIELNPNYAESYNLYAFISIVRNEEVDEAIEYLKKALEIAPGNQWYLIHQAELYLQKEDFASALQIAARVTRTAGDKELKLYAQNALGRIITMQAAYEEIKNNKNRRRDYVLDTPLTDEELARLRARQMLESLNEALYKPKINEKRVLGYLTGIDCEVKGMIYSVRVDGKDLKLRSATFDSVRLVAFHREMMTAQIGCGPLDKESLAVINYRMAEDLRSKTSGEIVSIEFVPANFKFLN